MFLWNIFNLREKKNTLAAALSVRFCSMKRLGVFVVPNGWDASLSQEYLLLLINPCPFLPLSGERRGVLAY